MGGEGGGTYLQAAFHLAGLPHQVSYRKGITQPFSSNRSWKPGFNGKPSCLGKADWQEMSPGKIFSTYKVRRAILLSYARNNKDKLLNNCGMPNAPLRQSPSRQKDQTECRRTREHIELKITRKRSGSWFSKESWVKLSLRDVPSCPSTKSSPNQNTLLVYVSTHGKSKKNKN